MNRWFSWVLEIPLGSYVGLALCGLAVWVEDVRGIYIGAALAAASLWALRPATPSTDEHSESGDDPHLR